MRLLSRMYLLLIAYLGAFNTNVNKREKRSCAFPYIFFCSIYKLLINKERIYARSDVTYYICSNTSNERK